MFDKLKGIIKRKNKETDLTEINEAVDVDEILKTKDITLALQQTTYHPFEFDPMPLINTVHEELDNHLNHLFTKTDVDEDNGDICDQFLIEQYKIICSKMNQEFNNHRQALDKFFRGYSRQASTASEVIPLLIREQNNLYEKKSEIEDEINEIERRNKNVQIKKDKRTWRSDEQKSQKNIRN